MTQVRTTKVTSKIGAKIEQLRSRLSGQVILPGDDAFYVNFLGADEGDRVRAAYGSNYDRLARVKSRYDPDNLFRMNQNIKPSRESGS